MITYNGQQLVENDGSYSLNLELDRIINIL